MKHSHNDKLQPTIGDQVRALLAPVGLLLCCLGALFPPATVDAQSGFTFPLTETFMASTIDSNWKLGGVAALTSGNGDAAGNGWLRLTPNTTYQAGYAYYNTPIPTGRGLVVTFDYGAWGGNGADGLTFFLFDGATTTFNVGASGGSLGYAQKTGVKGLSNGYLGLGLDEFGNYSNPNEGRVGGPGQRKQAVVVRGPGNGTTTTGYAYLAGTGTLIPALPRLDCPVNFSGVTGIGITGSCGGSGAPRPADTVYYRQVQITITPVGTAYQVAVAMKFNKGTTTWTPLFGPFTMPTSAPGTLKMGFAASTGGNYNYHEIRNLTVTQQVPDLTASKAVQNASTGGGSVEPGNELLYTVMLNNNTATAINNVHFLDPIPANTTYVANSAVVPGGAALQGTNPIAVTNITVPANGQATITFKVQVNTPLPADVTQISNQGTYTYTTSSQTDGDAVTEGNQVTTINVTAGPNFDTSTKTVTYEDLDGNSAVSPGDRLVYHVVLPNTGNQNSPTTSFTDLLPSNTTYVTGSATASQGTVSYNSTAKTLNWTVSVNAGGQATLDFKVTVNNGVQIRDVISNQGTITYGSTSVLTDADLATPGKQPTVILAGGGATIEATKSATVVGGGALQPGGLVRYTIQLVNTGSYSITGATFADTIPANTTYVAASTDRGVATSTAPSLNITGINLASRVTAPNLVTATIQLTVQVNSPLTGVTQISNQGLANYDSNQGGVNNTSLQTDGDPTTAGQQPTVNAIPNSDLAVTKTVDNSNPAEAGTVVFTVGVMNQGPISATNVTVADLLPGGLTFTAASASAGSYISPTWTVGTLANGASATLILSATVNLGRGGSTITNTASVTSTLYDANPANNSASAGLLVKTTTLSGTVTDAQSGAPLVDVTLTITDSLGNTCTATTGAGGAYLVTSGVIGCLLAPGAATVAATGGVPSGYLLPPTTTTITAGAANSGNLTLVRPSLSGFVTDLGSGVAQVGAVVTLTQSSLVCTTTAGVGGAYSFVSGAGCNLTAGTAVITATQTGYQTATATPTISNAGPTTQDLTMGTADLLITKSDGQTIAQPGEILDYLLTVVNQGSITATNITITDTLPISYLTYFSDTTRIPYTNPEPGKYAWMVGDLAPGAATSFTLRAQVTTTLPNGTTGLSNYAYLTSPTPDRDRTNNEVSDVDTVSASPDLTIAKTFAAGTSLSDGSVITYYLTGGNLGHATATRVIITETMDSRLTYLDGTATLAIDSASAAPITPITSTNNMTFELLSLVPGSAYTITYATVVTSPNTGPLGNTAIISAAELDPNLANNVASVSIPIVPAVDLYVQKSASTSVNPATPGTRINYALTYGNNGTVAATAVVISDVVPAHTTIVTDSITNGGVYISATNTVTWTLDNLASHGAGAVGFAVQIGSPLPAGVNLITNTAFITATSGGAEEVAPDNNTASANTPVTAQPDLTIRKSDGLTEVLAGELVTYTITYSNTGNQAATGVWITDTLLAGLEYVDSTPTNRVSTETYTVTWAIGDLAVNEMRTLTVTARVTTTAKPGSVVANRMTAADDSANGADINPAGNIDTDSNLVIAPYIVLEKQATAQAYVGQPVTYTIRVSNTEYATALGVVVTDVLPANTILVPGSITGGGVENGGVITWTLGDKARSEGSTLRFAVIPNASAGGFTQTLPTLTTENISENLVITSSTQATTTAKTAWCDFEGCARFRGIYQGENGAPPTGWNDNPRLTTFDDSSWGPPVASNTREFVYWANSANLSAEWVAMHTISETIGNFTFFRQSFCLPLNAMGMNGSVQMAGDDVSDIYLNGIYLGQEVGAGAADTFAATSGLQTGLNVLAVQLLNNRHGGHATLDGRDHSGLLFNLGARYTGLRPFTYAPTTVFAGQNVRFAVDELAISGRGPYSYTLNFGDSNSAPYQTGTAFTHLYGASGVYTATVTARSQDGCIGSDQIVITVLPATANLLANPARATYQDASAHPFAATSGAGVELLPAADLSITKTLFSNARVPGLPVTYQITVTNLGPNNVISATVLDTLPAVVSSATWTCSPGSGAKCTISGSGALSATVDLQAGSTITYTLTITIAANATGTLENTATVAPPNGVTDLVTTNNVSSDSGPLTPQVSLAITKTSSPKPGLAPGRGVNYVILVSNGGHSDAPGVSIADVFTSTLTGVTWTCVASSGSACTASGSGHLADTATILAGGALTYTVAATVDPTALAGTELTNTATATYASTPATATDSNTLVAMTSLSTAKDAHSATGASSRTAPFIDADGNGAISPGDTLSYTVVITSGATIAYNVVYNDALDANTVLVVGSVGCDSACTVVQGNGARDAAVSVRMASLNSTATIFYQATVSDTLPFQLATLANQGYVGATNAAAIATNDPTTAAAQDPTVLRLTMGSIRGVAWVDNGDGMRATGEPAIPNVVVTLYYTDTQNQAQQVSANTDASGAYTFSVLAAGNYQVAFGLREGFSFGPTWGQVVDNKVNPTTGATALIALTANQQLTNTSSGQLSNLEYGYLPASYVNTILVQDGARHVVPDNAGERLYLGTTVITATDGTESPTASGPGDGVVRPPLQVWTPGATGTLTVTTSGSGQLYGWFDWDYNGVFDNASEGQDLGMVITGTQAVTLTVGTGYTTTRPLFARIRLYPAGYNQEFNDIGVIYNGEVEDYGWYAIQGTDLRITKTGSPSQVGSGAQLTYTIVVANLGPNVAQSVTVTEQLPVDGVTYLTHTVSAGTTFVPLTGGWTIPTLAASDTATLTLVTQVTADTAVTNTAVVNASTPDPILSNNAVTVTTPVTPTELQGVVYDLGSAEPVAGAQVVIVDSADHIFTMTTGADGVYRFAGSGSAPLALGPVTATATFPGYMAGSATGAVHAGEVNTMNIPLCTANLLVTKDDARTSVSAGDLVTYTIAINNIGTLTATSVVVTDVLPAFMNYVTDDARSAHRLAPPQTYAWDTPDLAPGAGYTFTLTARVALSLPNGTTTLSNSAVARTASPEKDLPNNEHSDHDTVIAQPDLFVRKAAIATLPLSAGATITYVLAGENLGYATATGVVITDTHSPLVTFATDSVTLSVDGHFYTPTVTYAAGVQQAVFGLPPDLTPGVAYILTYTVQVSSTLPSGVAAVTNTVVIANREADGAPADNSTTLSLSTHAGADLYVNKTAQPVPTPAIPSGQILYVLQFGNKGSALAATVILTDQLPTGVTLLSATPGYSYDAGVRLITWNIGNIAVQANGSMTVSVQIDNPLPPDVLTLQNTAAITTTSLELLPEDNTDSAFTPVSAALTLVKTAAPTTYSAVGQIITYSYLVTNRGNVQLPGPATIADNKLASVDCPPVTFLAPGEEITCTASYTITQADLDAGFVTNEAWATDANQAATSPTVTATVTAVLSTILTGAVTDMTTGMPIPGATVVVTDSAGHVYTSAADSNGRYIFTGTPTAPLAAGPATVAGSALNYGVDVQSPILVAGATNIQDLQLLQQPGAVQGVIYIDADGDGVYAPGMDTPLPNVTAVITGSHGVTYVVTTNVNGFYSQTVPVGDTVVDIDERSLPANAALTVGNTEPTFVVVPQGGIVDANTGYVILRLRAAKFVSEGQPEEVGLGDDIEFTIIVTNETVIAVSDVTVVEIIPEGLMLSPLDPNGWTPAPDGRTATCVIAGPIAPGAAVNMKVLGQVNSVTSMTIVNTIAVVLAGSGSGSSIPVAGVEAATAVVINPPPTAIELVSFNAVYDNGAMLVNWVTAWEQNTFGFHLYRAESDSFDGAMQINQEMIPGKGTGGGEYTYLDYVFADRAVTPNRTYWYWLQEIETTGDTSIYGPTRATAAPSTVPNWSGSLFLPLINK